MKRREFITLFGAVIAACPLGAAAAQQSEKVWRIAFFSAAAGPNYLADAFREGLREFPEPLLWTHRRHIVDAAQAERLPAIFGYRDAAELGALMSYGPDLVDLFKRGAGYVDKITKGAQPADLPVEQPTKFELVTNLKTANALGLTIPPAILARADEVIE
jgi:hypothetical protein